MAVRVGAVPSTARGDAAGRALIATLASELTGDPADALRVGAVDCVDCGRAHGAPIVAGGSREVGASLSRAAGWAVAAVSDAGPVGVDAVGALSSAQAEALAEVLRMPAADAREVARRWAVVEAVLKADGRGLRVDPAGVRVDAAGAAAELDGVRYAVAEVEIAGVPDGVVVVVATRL